VRMWHRAEESNLAEPACTADVCPIGQPGDDDLG